MPWNATNSRQLDSRGQRQTDRDGERGKLGERGGATSLAAMPGRLGANHKNKTKETTRATVSQCHVDSTHFDTALLLLQLGAPWVLLVVAVSTESWLWPRDKRQRAKVALKVGKKNTKERKRARENTQHATKSQKNPLKSPQEWNKKKKLHRVSGKKSLNSSSWSRSVKERKCPDSVLYLFPSSFRTRPFHFEVLLLLLLCLLLSLWIQQARCEKWCVGVAKG